MKRQAVQTDRITGVLIHYYVDIGQGRARPRSMATNTGLQVEGTKGPPAVEGAKIKGKVHA